MGELNLTKHDYPFGCWARYLVVVPQQARQANHSGRCIMASMAKGPRYLFYLVLVQDSILPSQLTILHKVHNDVRRKLVVCP